jgi:hypothetical protein
LRREADRLRFQKADERVGLVDGAVWIRQQMQLHFAELDALGLDFYHLSKNVHRARRKVFGEESPEGKAWRSPGFAGQKRPMASSLAKCPLRHDLTPPRTLVTHLHSRRTAKSRKTSF